MFEQCNRCKEMVRIDDRGDIPHDCSEHKCKIELQEPECDYCQKIADNGGFGPSHFASASCQSGGKNHCTCDTCF